MPQRKELGTISVITDDDTGMYSMGEVDGGFNGLLREHIERHGHEGLLNQLSYMTFNVVKTMREINGEKANGSAVSANPS